MESLKGFLGDSKVSLAAEVPFLNITAIDIHFGRYFPPFSLVVSEICVSGFPHPRTDARRSFGWTTPAFESSR
jgi:hypothetical protein